MSSTLNPTKLAYTISIKKHLNHILNNPRLMKKMYFSRGIETPEKSELWLVIQAKPLFWVKAVSSSMGVLQNKIIQSFFSMGETCDKLVRLSQTFFIYTELKLLYRI